MAALARVARNGDWRRIATVRGLGTALVTGALDDARARGLRVVPLCPFVDAFMRRHPEYADVAVADPARRT